MTIRVEVMLEEDGSMQISGSNHGEHNMRRAIYEAALWSRERVTAMEADAVVGVRAVVVGHTPMDRMTSLGNTLYIDTGAVFRGRDFTIIDAETLQPV